MNLEQQRQQLKDKAEKMFRGRDVQVFLPDESTIPSLHNTLVWMEKGVTSFTNN